MPIYDGARLRKELSGPAGRLRVEAELARALLDGPGIVVLAAAFYDPWIVDQGLEWPPPEPEATVSRPESAPRRRAGET